LNSTLPAGTWRSGAAASNSVSRTAGNSANTGKRASSRAPVFKVSFLGCFVEAQAVARGMELLGHADMMAY